MNKRMREILAKMEQLRNEAKAFKDEKKFDDAQAKLTEIADLQKEYNVEKALYEAEQGRVPDEPKSTTKKANGFAVIAKLLSKKSLNESEKALVYGDDGETPAVSNDENLLVPEDVRVEINELRKSYVSAKDLVTVIPTNSLAGSFNFESGTPAGLTDFDDGDDVPDGSEPTFVAKPFAIKFKGALIKIGNILKGSEKAGLMAYLNRWFVRNAIISENSKIFTVLAAGKSAKTLADWKALKTSINKDLDPSALIDGVIVTNQTGFDILDSALDGTGKPVLNDDISTKTGKTFCGLPIKVFSDAQLPNVSGKAPVFYGSLKAGAYFIEKQGLEFAVSEHYYFGKNSTALRVIEGFDVIQADADAYCYGKLG